MPEGSRVESGAVLARLETESVEASRVLAESSPVSSIRRTEAPGSTGKSDDVLDRPSPASPPTLSLPQAVLVHEADASVLTAPREGQPRTPSNGDSPAQIDLAHVVWAFLKAVQESGETRRPSRGSRDVTVIVTSVRGSGLVTAIIRNALRLNLAALATSLAEAGGESCATMYSSPDSPGETYEISALGASGPFLLVQPIQNGHMAHLAVGAVRKSVVVAGPHDTLDTRPMVYLTLAYDPRVIDLAKAARLMSRVVFRLERLP